MEKRIKQEYGRQINQSVARVRITVVARGIKASLATKDNCKQFII